MACATESSDKKNYFVVVDNGDYLDFTTNGAHKRSYRLRVFCYKDAVILCEKFVKTTGQSATVCKLIEKHYSPVVTTVEHY